MLDNVKMTVDLARKLDNIELNKRIIDLQSNVLTLMEENARLKDDKSALERKLATHTEFVFKNDAYWTASGHGPFCAHCWDAKLNSIRLHSGATKGTFGCPACGAFMWTEEFP